MIYLKYAWISDTKYDPSGYSNFLFHVGANILNLFLHDSFIFFHVQQMLRFDKGTYLSSLFESILSARLNNSLCGYDDLLYLQLMYIEPIFLKVH